MMKTLNVATTINPRFDHVTPIEATRSDVTITHRCHVIAELLAVGRSGLVDVVLVASDLDMVSLETLQQLQDADGYGPRLVAITDVTDERARLNELGIPVASPDLSGDELVQWLQRSDTDHETAAVEAAGEFSAAELQFLERMDPDNTATGAGRVEQPASKGQSGRRAAPYDPATDIPEDHVSEVAYETPDQLGHLPSDVEVTEVPAEAAAAFGATGPVGEPHDDETPSGEGTPLGHVTAVWGPIGSPGVTTVAVNMAVESALAGFRTLLIDADTYGAAVAVHLGLLDDTAAIAQACRSAEHRGIDAAGLARFAQSVAVDGTRLDVVTGLTRSERWPQVRAAAWQRVLQAAREGWDHVIIDCGFGLEEDEELSFDIPAPQRNATTITAVTTADTVIAVGSGDPVGFVRLMKGLEQLSETTQSPIVPVINKVTAMSSGVSPKQQLSSVWERFGSSDPLKHFLPWAPEITAAALLSGKAVAESAPKSEFRTAIGRVFKAATPVGAITPSTTPPAAKPVPKRTSPSRFRDVVGGIKRRLSGRR